jgi:aspartyl-tRNA(Asn)/glutamyl-tRNA(Gln) amidotransferase subunit C
VPDPITQEIFDHLVALAELELSAEEAEYLRGELNSQLSAIRELEAIELVDQIPITSHGVPFTEESRPPLRNDTVVPSDHADEILDQAAEVVERYIVVPDIPSEALE